MFVRSLALSRYKFYWMIRGSSWLMAFWRLNRLREFFFLEIHLRVALKMASWNQDLGQIKNLIFCFSTNILNYKICWYQCVGIELRITLTYDSLYKKYIFHLFLIFSYIGSYWVIKFGSFWAFLPWRKKKLYFFISSTAKARSY